MTNAHVLHIHVVAITSLNGKLRKMKKCTYFVVTHGSECLKRFVALFISIPLYFCKSFTNYYYSCNIP